MFVYTHRKLSDIYVPEMSEVHISTKIDTIITFMTNSGNSCFPQQLNEHTIFEQATSFYS